MSNENIVRMFAGSVVIVGTLLSQLVHPNFIYLVYFVGANLLQSSITHFCPLEIILKKVRGQSKVENIE